MVILTDIDGVLADFISPFLEYVNRTTGFGFEYEDVDQPDLDRVMDTDGLDKLLHDAFVQEGGNLYLHPLPGAQETLSHLRKVHQILYVTSRPADLCGVDTANWLAWHSFPPAAIAFVEGGEGKAQMASYLGADVFVEDNPLHALAVAEFCRVLLYDQPWNRGYEWEEFLSRPPASEILRRKPVHYHSIQRVFGWIEIECILREVG